jgi:hypothetical protein
MISERISVNCWTVVVEEDPETKDLVIPLSPEMLEVLGWAEGDTLVWEIVRGENETNQVILSKKEATPQEKTDE